MLELDTCYTLSNIPYITYDALEEYAEKLVHDFAPECLRTPIPMDVDKFLGHYLNLSVDYRHISHDRNILGMTAFSDGSIDVLNDETGLVEQMPVRAGTVILDSSLTVKRNEPIRRFTGGHEGTHWILHRKAFAEDNPFGPAGVYSNQYLAAKEGRVDYSRKRTGKTDIEYMERQADFLSSAILMPRPALRVVFRNFFKFYNEKPRRIVRGTSPLDDCYIKQLVEYVADKFLVSKHAVRIRLEKLGAIADNVWQYNPKKQRIYYPVVLVE